MEVLMRFLVQKQNKRFINKYNSSCNHHQDKTSSYSQDCNLSYRFMQLSLVLSMAQRSPLEPRQRSKR